MGFLPIDARRLRRGVAHVFLPFVTLLALIACDVLNQPESVPPLPTTLKPQNT